jgi:hypothetical protein
LLRNILSQVEMSRAVRLALWDYKEGSALTAACDADVEDKCPSVRKFVNSLIIKLQLSAVW